MITTNFVGNRRQQYGIGFIKLCNLLWVPRLQSIAPYFQLGGYNAFTHNLIFFYQFTSRASNE